MTIASLCEIGIRALNEDVAFVDENRGLFAVFDGASSLDNYISDSGKTGGYIASHTAADVFRSGSGSTLKTLFSEANNRLEQLHKDAGIDTSDAIHRFGTTVAAAWLHEDTVELLQCADSVAIIIDKDGKASAPLGYHDQDLSEMLEWQRLAKSGLKIDEIRPIVRPMTITKRRQVNEAYGTMNGDPRAGKFASHTTIATNDIKHILLLTDGMYIPKEDPAAEEDWQQYADIFLHGGLKELFDTVRSLENSDPDVTRYPRYKPHDDASGVAISL